MTCVFTLDIAMKVSGWAVAGDDWPKPVHGVFETDGWRQDREAENLIVWEEFLNQKFTLYPITHLVTERIFVDVRLHKLNVVIKLIREKKISKAIKMLYELLQSPNFDFKATQAQFMLQGEAIKQAKKRKIAVFEASTDDWRDDFLGFNRRPADAYDDPNFWKDMAIKVAADFGCLCAWHDEAEAVGILVHALRKLDRTYKVKTTGFHNKQVLDLMLGRGVHA